MTMADLTETLDKLSDRIEKVAEKRKENHKNRVENVKQVRRKYGDLELNYTDFNMYVEASKRLIDVVYEYEACLDCSMRGQIKCLLERFYALRSQYDNRHKYKCAGEKLRPYYFDVYTQLSVMLEAELLVPRLSWIKRFQYRWKSNKRPGLLLVEYI